MNTIKRLFQALMLVALCVLMAPTVTAQVFPSNLSLTNGVNQITTNGVIVTGGQFVDTSGSANLIIIYDNNAYSTNYINPAHTNYVFSTISFTNTYIDSVGYTNNYIYTLGTNTLTPVAISTNEARRIAVLQIPPNGMVTYGPYSPVLCNRGLVIYARSTVLGTVSTLTSP